LRYTKSHEWVRRVSDGTLEIGITDHAQAALGDLVFIEVPEVGRRLKAGEASAVVESVKAASDVYSPLSGQVIASNQALATQPELLNQEPYGGGWLFRLGTGTAAEIDALMNAAEYAKYLADEAK
jgi:glycine cleavage system H protein